MIYDQIECRFGSRGKVTQALLKLLLAVCFWSSPGCNFGFFSGRQRTTSIADAIVVGGILLPHGDFALDPTFFANGTIEREVANEVAKGAHRAGRWLIELQQNHRHIQTKTKNDSKKNKTGPNDDYTVDDEPMIVLLTTPHGIKLDYDYGIYISSKGSGTATIGGDCTGFRDASGFSGRGGMRGRSNERLLGMKEANHHCQHKPYNVTLDNIDLAPIPFAEDLLTVLRQEKNHPVSGVYSYNDETPIPLNWGEIVPLLLLPKLTTSSNNQLLPMVWTFPYRRYDHSVEMVPELLQVGADIMEWAQQRPEKIAIIVSGDLSHTHQPSGPYGYSAASALFDEAIGLWAGGHTNASGESWNPCRPEAAKALLNRARELQPDAKSCGFTGYIMWHGMMCSSSLTSGSSITASNDCNHENSLKDTRPIKFDSKVFVNRNVTYYGMIGAVFEPSSVSDDESGHVDKNVDFIAGMEDK